MYVVRPWTMCAVQAALFVGLEVLDKRWSYSKNVLTTGRQSELACCRFCPVSGNFHGLIAWVERTSNIQGQKRAKCTEMRRASNHAESSLSAWFTYVVQNRTTVLVPKRSPVPRVSRWTTKIEMKYWGEISSIVILLWFDWVSFSSLSLFEVAGVILTSKNRYEIYLKWREKEKKIEKEKTQRMKGLQDTTESEEDMIMRRGGAEHTSNRPIAYYTLEPI